MYRTANLQSCILYIYSTNIGTEYFKHGVYSPFFFSSKCSLFHNSNVFGSCIIHILYTGCAKIKKKLFRRQKVKMATNILVIWSLSACNTYLCSCMKVFGAHRGWNYNFSNFSVFCGTDQWKPSFAFSVLSKLGIGITLSTNKCTYIKFHIKTLKIAPKCFDPKIIPRELRCSLLKSF